MMDTRRELCRARHPITGMQCSAGPHDPREKHGVLVKSHEGTEAVSTWLTCNQSLGEGRICLRYLRHQGEHSPQ